MLEGVTSELEADDKDDKINWRPRNYISYVNVGMWESTADFMAAVGKNMSLGRTIKEDFEAAPRRRDPDTRALATRRDRLTGGHLVGRYFVMPRNSLYSM